jgi:hypothetical protein
VEITCTGTPGNSHAPDLFTGEGYTYTPYGYVGTWEGLSDTISLTATAQVRATKIVVTLEGGESQLLPPTFYPDCAEFTNEVEVALYCATQGAEVHYIEGSNENDFDWSTEAIYDGPFVLNRTKTLTAWSVLGDVRSSYVTATFTRIKPTVPVPEFTPASTTFKDSINVTIACPDTTAVVYYSFDEEQWTEYTDVITVKIDANIYANLTLVVIVCLWFKVNVKNSKIFACRSAFNSHIIDVTHFHRLFDFYKANLWKLEFTVYNANIIALIERPVALMMVMLTFETWILTQVLEEILVRSVQITQSLL